MLYNYGTNSQNIPVQIIKSNLQPQNNIKPIYYYIGTWLGQILHARLRMQCSSLNHHLFRKEVNRLLLMMNFCTFKNISVFRVFVKSVEPNNNKSVFKLIGKLMMWIYLSLVALWWGQCSRKWSVVSAIYILQCTTMEPTARRY
jgi:hypothetical protein